MDESELTFEQAVDQLEKIVGRLERGDGDLSAALESFEKGVRLMVKCHAMLDEVERSVGILTGVDEEGNPAVAPFDAAATEAPGKQKGRARSKRDTAEE